MADIVEKGEGAIALSPTNIDSNCLTYEKDNTYISTYKYEESPEIKIFAGDIIFVKTGSTVGKVAFVDNIIDRTTLNPQLVVLKQVKCNPYFLYLLMAAPCFQKHIKRITVGGAVPTLSQNEMGRIGITLPPNAEQDRISALFKLLNYRIETQKKIIEDLKKLKDAIAEKLFCAPEDESPELRIVNSSDRWISYRLKDVCQRVSERNSQGLSSLVLTIAAQYGLVSQTDFFNKSVASENLSNYYLIQKGDFAYNKSYSGEYVWGAVKRLELYEKGVLSPLYICFRPNPLIGNSDFLSHYFETHKWHNGIAQIAGEGARNHGLLNVSISDYFATLHRLPGLAEQKKIASYLNLLSDKISLANKELKCYSSQKQYLLARMFI